MKKHILPGLLIGAMMTFASSQSNAQIRNDRGTFNMPGKGDVLVETQARINLGGGHFFDLNDGFLGNLNSGLDTATVGTFGVGTSNYFPMLKLRKFTSNGMAWRMLLNISYNNQKVSVGSVDTKVTNFGVGVGLGAEKIFTPAERLNTYVGADLMLGFARIGAKSTGVNNDQNAFGFGLRGFTGMDYYFLPKVYAGIELGWGLSYNHYSAVHFNVGDNDMTSAEFTLTPYVTPFFRLGYVLGCSGKKMHGNGEPSYRSHGNDDDE